MQRLRDPAAESAGCHLQWRNLSDEGAQLNNSTSESEAFKKEQSKFLKDVSVRDFTRKFYLCKNLSYHEFCW
jgi:hypothetical protein